METTVTEGDLFRALEVIKPATQRATVYVLYPEGDWWNCIELILQQNIKTL